MQTGRPYFSDIARPLFRGTTYDGVYEHRDPSTGAPVSLDGCTLYFVIKSKLYDESANNSSAVLNMAIENIQDVAGNGVVDFQFTIPATTAPKVYFYSFVVKDSNGHVGEPTAVGRVSIEGVTANV